MADGGAGPNEGAAEPDDGEQQAVVPIDEVQQFVMPNLVRCERDPGDHTGCLPEGVYPVTLDLISQKLVAPWKDVNQQRADIWAEFVPLANQLDDLVHGPYTLLVGGSMTTDKRHPSDIDVITVIPQSSLDATPDHKRQRLMDNFNRGRRGLTDWYTMVFDDGPDPHEPPPSVLVHEQLDLHLIGAEGHQLMMQGYWTRLWPRHKSAGNRGYLMVRRNDDH